DGPNPTKVGAYFRLASGQRHEAGCAYNPVEVVTAIARGSYGLAQAEAGGRLRLVMPGDLGASKVKPPLLADGDAAAGTRSLTFTTTRPSIPPALNSAAKIVHFLQLHNFDPEAGSTSPAPPPPAPGPCPRGPAPKPSSSRPGRSPSPVSKPTR
ncbi:hypothetical protein AB0J08_41645, partial [Kitasatospora sp. NPDC050463]